MTNPPPGRRLVELTVTMEADDTADSEWEQRLGNSFEGLLRARIDSLALALEHGGYDGEHPDHPRIDWITDAQTHETRAGYREWVLHRLHA